MKKEELALWIHARRGHSLISVTSKTISLLMRNRVFISSSVHKKFLKKFRVCAKWTERVGSTLKSLKQMERPARYWQTSNIRNRILHLFYFSNTYEGLYFRQQIQFPWKTVKVTAHLLSRKGRKSGAAMDTKPSYPLAYIMSNHCHVLELQEVPSKYS